MCTNELLSKIVYSVSVGLGFVGAVLGFVVLFLPWTRYAVDDGLRPNISEQLGDLYAHWPQLFYSRGRHLLQICFPGIDRKTWLQVFGRKSKPCLKSGSCALVTYCLTDSEFNAPVNLTDFQDTESPNEAQQLGLLQLAFALVIIHIALAVPTVCLTPVAASWPRRAGLVFTGVNLVKECAIVSLVCVYYFADVVEDSITELPHYGFVMNNVELRSATSKSLTDGFWLACSMLVFTSIHVILYLFLWGSHMLHDDDELSRPLCLSSSDTHDNVGDLATAKLTTGSRDANRNYGAADSVKDESTVCDVGDTDKVELTATANGELSSRSDDKR